MYKFIAFLKSSSHFQNLILEIKVNVEGGLASLRVPRKVLFCTCVRAKLNFPKTKIMLDFSTHFTKLVKKISHFSLCHL